MLKLFTILILLQTSVFSIVHAQETNSRPSGRVLTVTKDVPSLVTVTVIHEPTQNKYVTLTGKDGYFNFFNLKPGGPYTIIFSSAGYETLQQDNLFIPLSGDHFYSGNNKTSEFTLQQQVMTLGEVIIETNNNGSNKSGIETNITGSILKSMPSISRSFHDYVRLIPHAKVTGEGVMSLAGQNNRFNAFFIDGGNNNDIQGLSVNGMNGGQTGSPPISVEALEEINILLAPYDVQYGNFTGGSINGITRSGTNEIKSSAWYYFRNENMAGKAPQALEKPGSPGEYYRPRLSKFFNQTFGAWNSGPLARNKVFYFALVERQIEVNPRPFNINEYRGNSSPQQLIALGEFIRDHYGYDAGSLLESKDVLDAYRLNIKIDWNASVKDKFMLSYRHNKAQRTFPVTPSSPILARFRNSGIMLPARTHTASVEWKHFFKRNVNNRLLFTYTNQVDDRKWIGKPFPYISIFDGSGTIIFGSDLATGIYDFKANDFTLFNLLKFVSNRHVISTGTDINFTVLNNKYVSGFFGAYQFRNLNDFISNASPTRLQRSFPLSGDRRDQSKFFTLRSSYFANDEIRLSANLRINLGIRLDINSVLSRPGEDRFFNDSAIQVISKYYDLAGARSGKPMDAQWAISPRIGFEYNLPGEHLKVKGGGGVFVGHMVNLWISDVFNSINGSIEIMNPLQFIPDPYGQPSAQSLNLNPEDFKGTMVIMAKQFKFPSVFRSSLAIEKKLRNHWVFSIEGMITKNIQEVIFRNINIAPPARKSALPDSRFIYSTNSEPSKIELRSSGITNPYSQVFLLANNQGKKGFSYNFSLSMQKQSNNFSFAGSYSYGNSNLLFEVTGPQTPVASQWRNVETVNGRNQVSLSTSDNDLRHRFIAWLSNKFKYAKSRASTTISLYYNGQSGTPYSYVYSGSMVNENGNRENFDLIYIPTLADLTNMSFSNLTFNGVTYTAQQQKDLLNTFIESDKYLRQRRGQFAERNGARLPFTHTIDLRLQQDFTIKSRRKTLEFTLTYDVFNFTNMLNRNWGKIHFLANDSYPLIRFSGYANTTTLTPQYQFTPFSGKPYSLQSSTVPGNSARWISQLGIKVYFN